LSRRRLSRAAGVTEMTDALRWSSHLDQHGRSHKPRSPHCQQ